MSAAALPYNMPLDMARRTLVQRAPLAPASAEGRHKALAQLVPDVNELARGFDFTAEEVRESLVAQQLQASSDIWGLIDEVKPQERAGMAIAAQQIMAKAVAASGDFTEGSVARQAFEGLPDGLRSAISPSEINSQRDSMRPR